MVRLGCLCGFFYVYEGFIDVNQRNFLSKSEKIKFVFFFLQLQYFQIDIVQLFFVYIYICINKQSKNLVGN